MSLNIEYIIFKKRGLILKEEELPKLDFIYEDFFDEFGKCPAALQFYVDNDLTNQVEDELPALIKNLCILVPKELHEKGESLYFYFDQSGTVSFKQVEGSIKMEGDGVKSFLYPRNEFVSALQACTYRFLNVLKRLEVSDSSQQNNIESLIAMLKPE